MEVERVQSIAAGLSRAEELPEDFIRPENERPGTTTATFDGPAPDVPVIDLSNPDRDGLVRDMTSAAQEWGIFQVVNHGIEAELIKRLQEVGEQFFHLPPEVKEEYATKPGGESLEGYGTTLQKDTTGKKAWVDFFFHIVWPPSRINYTIWPRNPPSYREVNEEYTKRVVGVVDEILKCLSLGLGLEGSVLKDKLGGQDLEFLLKINYYPPCPRPDLALGVVAHSDMSGLTVLVPNNVTGLQVFKDDLWLGVKYIPNALIIHLGDQMEILSNGKYKSVYHRSTVNKEKTRMSWPVFCCPPGETMVGPLPQLVSEDNPPKFKTKKYKDYSYCKLNKLPQ